MLDTRSGFVAVVGKPNVGKSTLINRLVGRKVAITSPKPQTTRQRLLGVKNIGQYQIVFVDTPGLVFPRNLLGKTMVKHSKDALLDCDVSLFMVDASDFAPTEEDRFAAKALFREVKERDDPPAVFLAVNKVDEIKDKRKLLPTIENYSTLGSFAEVFPISALKGENIEPLVEAICKSLPENPRFFPDEESSPQDDNLRISEIIREKILFQVHQEVPHGIAVGVEEMRPGKTPETLYIRAVIYVERASHKGILVGANGKMLKKIGTLAREEISREFERPVYLDLWVKVKEGWQDREEMLRFFGYS